MAEPLTIRLKTLTPLWTGGADQRCDRVHETVLLGSLRWWYEAIVRGLGGDACDPVQNPCVYDDSKLHNGLCLACQVFGATGWRRRFRLLVSDETTSGGPNGARRPTGNRYKRNKKDRPSWYFKGGRTGNLKLRFVPTAPDFDPILIQGTLTLIEHWGGLAAKPQLGYGLIKIISEVTPLDVFHFVDVVSSMAASRPLTTDKLPSLDTMFFARIKAPDQGITATLNMKYDVRAAFRHAFSNNHSLRHWVCGSVRGNERQASKINFSQAVDGVVRVWGWIPDSVPAAGVGQDQVVDQIKDALAAYGTVSCWREFDSVRDTVSQQTDMAAFLTSLLEDQS